MKSVKFSRDWKFRIQDILNAIRKIETFTSDLSLEQMNIAIIGEASKHIPAHIQASFPDFPWKKINGMRNLLIHEYFGVNADIIWYTAKNHLPELKQLLDKISYT